MIVYATRLWKRLRGDWRDSCRAGPPVPETHRCEALHCPSVALTELVEGERATVSCLNEPETPAAGRLAAYGLLPGVAVTLVQRHPAWVVRIGHAVLAMDDSMAGHVRVLRESFAAAEATAADGSSIR
jgi:Fe2+ transport system protein FeoA